MRAVQLYLAIGVRAFRRATTYRSAYLAGLITNAFFAAIMSYVFLAVYSGQDVVAGMRVHDTVTYIWIAQSLISIGAGWIFTDIEATIRSGDVVTDLTRPWSFFGYWLSRIMGERLFNVLVRGSLTYLIGVLYFNVRVPTFDDLGAFVVALLLGMLVSFAYGFIINLIAFWTLDIYGIISFANLLLGFFSGLYLPLVFFPEPLATIAALLPFQAIANLPALIFMGRIQGVDVVQALVLQLFWVVVLFGIAHALLRAAMRKVIVQGG